MNSSGIKRGLATTAISALAVAGLPLIASSASAAVGDELVTAYAGPARNGGAEGAVVVLETKGASIDPAKLTLMNTALTGDASAGNPQNNPGQTVTLNSASPIDPDGPSNEFGDNDGYGETTLRISVTTPNPGDTATFAVFNDDNGDGQVQAGEARTQVSITTAGNPTAVEISPTSQVAPAGQLSGNYKLTIKDSAGRTTQLTGAETIDLSATGGTFVSESANTVTAGEAPRGTRLFKASNGTPGGYTITATGATGVPASATAQATLNVVTAANITANEVDVVTGADSWPTDPAQRNYATPVNVRVDQGSITLEFDSNDPNSTVAFTATSSGGNGITFGGNASKNYSVVLDAQGKGSVTITPDAGTIQDGDGLTVIGSGLNLDINYVRQVASGVDVQAANGQTATYVSKIGGSVDVVVKVVDGFGQPVTSGFVNVRRSGGANNETSFSAKKPVGADGTVTFTLTDTKATPNSTAPDTILAQYFVDEFAPTAADGPESVGTIRYTVDGLGNPISFTVDNTSVDGTGYDASQVTLNPLTVDGNADTQTVGANTAGNNDEFVAIGIVGGTPGSPVTVAADNGGRIVRVAGGGGMPANGDEIADGAASVTGAAGDSYYLLATKTGPINITVSSAGQTKTAAVTAVPLSSNFIAGTARNVAIEGPTAATAGDLVNFTATITDGYGNPVSGAISQFGLNVRVSGPARLQDTDSTSDANGMVDISVRLDDDADGPVTVQVAGVPNFGYQFGDAANTITNAAGGANNAPGIPASVASASATIDDVTNLAELQQAVEDAQAAVDAAQADVTAAQADLDVATTEQTVAQTNVDELSAKKDRLRDKLNLAKDKGNKQKAKTTRKKLRQTKRDLRDAQDTLTIATAKVAGAQSVLDAKQDILEQAQADLAEAQANLEAAQGDTQG